MVMKEVINVFPEIVVVKRLYLIGEDEWQEMIDWCKRIGLVAGETLMFRNHWSDNSGECYSFEITDEKARMMFILRWK